MPPPALHLIGLPNGIHQDSFPEMRSLFGAPELRLCCVVCVSRIAVSGRPSRLFCLTLQSGQSFEKQRRRQTAILTVCDCYRSQGDAQSKTEAKAN